MSLDEPTSKIYEKTMITVERYGEAVRDEMGLLNAKMALSLLQESRDTKELDLEMYYKFMDQTSKYLTDMVINLARGREHDSLQRLKDIMESIRTNQDSKDVEEGLMEINKLMNSITKLADEARSDYYKILRRY